MELTANGLNPIKGHFLLPLIQRHLTISIVKYFSHWFVGTRKVHSLMLKGVPFSGRIYLCQEAVLLAEGLGVCFLLVRFMVPGHFYIKL